MSALERQATLAWLGAGTLILAGSLPVAAQRNARNPGATAAPMLATIYGQVVAYVPEQSIAIESRQRGAAPLRREFRIVTGVSEIVLQGDARTLEVGMPATVWTTRDESRVAARVVAGAGGRRGPPAEGAGMAGRTGMGGPSLETPGMPAGGSPGAVRRVDLSRQRTVPSSRPLGIVPAEVDRILADELFRALPAGATLAPCTSDELFLRRASLDLVGHLPSPAERAAFVAETVPEKRSRTIERLINDPRFGLNWARYWREVIMARRLATDTAEIEAALEVFLSDALNRNVAWDQVVRAFIECRGNPRERGEAALFAAQSADPVGVASEASRLFLGVQIQCAQCHDHPTDRWKREQFHEFAAFFARAGIKRVMGPSRQAVHELASFDDGPLARRTGSGPAGAREYFMPAPADPASPGRLMAPVFFVTGQRLQTGASDAERRGSLAAWLTARTNPWFARALVNRLWAELAGEGFSEPVDDLGHESDIHAPRTLDYLAGQFAANDYDLKWLYRVIMKTAAYQRESRPRRNLEQLPFLANVPQPLRADQLIDVLSDVVGVDFTTVQDLGTRRSRGSPANPRQLRLLFAYDPSAPRDRVASSIPQVLMLMNSPILNQAITARTPEAFLGPLLAGSAADRKVAEALYLRCLARRPGEAELAVCLELVRSSGNRTEAFEDIFWSLLNSEEFRYRN